MISLDEDLSGKINFIGVELGEMQSLSRVIKTCYQYNDDLKSWDIENLFLIMDLKLNEIKTEFNKIQFELNI